MATSSRWIVLFTLVLVVLVRNLVVLFSIEKLPLVVDDAHFYGYGEVPTDERSFQYHHRYSNASNLKHIDDRGLHAITATSGCRMARWVYVGDNVSLPTHFDDCQEAHFSQRLHSKTIINLQHGDTIYVTFRLLSHFVQNMLPHINKDVVIVSSQYLLIPRRHRPRKPILEALLNSAYVQAWFCTDIGRNAASLRSDPKIKPFPYGMIPRRRYDQTEKGKDLVMEFQAAFRDSVSTPKAADIFYSYFSLKTNKKGRKDIPRGQKLNYSAYLKGIAASRFVISPDGDRPECYRHYESLGLGAVPITQLDASIHSHLAPGPVVFSNQNWTTKALSELVDQYSGSVTNRNMAFEEYWMEYMERKVQRSLTFWDQCADSPSKLENFVARCVI